MSGTLGIKLDYSQRKCSDELDVYDIKSHLSDFQIEKLTYLFRCFNQTNTGYIEVCPEKLVRNQCQWSLMIKLEKKNQKTSNRILLDRLAWNFIFIQESVRAEYLKFTDYL